MNLTQKQYGDYIKQKTPSSPMGKNIFFAFLIGGLICVLGQGLTELYTFWGLNEEDALTATPMTLVFLGALLTGLNVYDNIAKFAGAGTIVPITGFANSIVSPAMEFKSEGLVLGLGAKMFVVAGPVLVYGISASVIYGLILALLG